MERSRKVQDSLYRLERGLNPFSLWPPEAGVSSAPARAHGVKQFDVLPPMARNILLISTTLPKLIILPTAISVLLLNTIGSLDHLDSIYDRLKFAVPTAVILL